MRLLFLTSAFPPESEGAATHLPEMAAELQSQGHGVQVLAVVNRHEVRDTYNFRVRRISRSQVRFVRDLRILAMLIRMGRKADVMMSYGIWWQAGLAALVTGTPWVIKFTGDKAWERAVIAGRTDRDMEEWSSAPDSIWDAFIQSLMRFWGRLARRWIVSSDTLLRIVLSWGVDREKAEMIPNGVPVNPRLHEDATYLAQWSGQEGLRLITAGHILRIKNLDEVLTAMSQFEDVRLVVAGDGPDLDRIKQRTQDLNLVERVLFTGKVSRLDLAGYVDECDALISNSKIGRFNYVIPEALARGKPVFASRRGVHPDLIEHGVNGWLHDGSSEALVKLISGLRDGSLAPNLAEASEPATWEQQVTLSRTLLESLKP